MARRNATHPSAVYAPVIIISHRFERGFLVIVRVNVMFCYLLSTVLLPRHLGDGNPRCLGWVFVGGCRKDYFSLNPGFSDFSGAVRESTND